MFSQEIQFLYYMIHPLCHKVFNKTLFKISKMNVWNYLISYSRNTKTRSSKLMFSFNRKISISNPQSWNYHNSVWQKVILIATKCFPIFTIFKNLFNLISRRSSLTAKQKRKNHYLFQLVNSFLCNKIKLYQRKTQFAISQKISDFYRSHSDIDT